MNPRAGIDRRTLFRYGAATGILAAMPAGRSAPASPHSPESPSVPSFDLEELTVAELQKRIESGAESARSLAEKYLARIEQLDRRGPLFLRSVLETNPDALAIAEKLDGERKAGRARDACHRSSAGNMRSSLGIW